jgi:lysophospholipase L1-like esterase
MKSTSVVTKDFLERISRPKSPFHSDYLAYRGGEISRQGLIARLPHVAMIGDSVSTGIYVSTPWSTLWRARRRHQRNWFLNVDPTSKIESIADRLEKMKPLAITHYGGIGAMVDDEGEGEPFSRRILGTRNFSGQIRQLTSATRFPDLILISIGHNNVDWARRSASEELQRPEVRLPQLRQNFKEIFTARFRKLLEHARQQPQRTAIIVFGLVNFGSYFKGRAEAERQRASDPRLYPHLEKTYEYLVSFLPDYRDDVIRLTEMVNRDLRAIVAELNVDPRVAANVQLRYSDALATADLSRAKLLHAVDGWHASAEGHNVLAEAAFQDLGPSLEFVGIV